MIVSRAVFVRLCGAALVGGVLPRWALPGDGAAPLLAAAASNGAARFRPHIGSLFTIVDAAVHARQQVRLTDIVETMVSVNVEQYALNFSGSAQAPLTHGLYTFHHESLGAVQMFITPVGAPAGTPTYQACFSRLVRTETQPCPISS